MLIQVAGVMTLGDLVFFGPPKSIDPGAAFNRGPIINGIGPTQNVGVRLNIQKLSSVIEQPSH